MTQDQQPAVRDRKAEHIELALDQRMQGTALADVPLRMRLTPTFDAPEGPHGWMNRTLFVGHGARYVGPDHTVFTYYEVL